MNLRLTATVTLATMAAAPIAAGQWVEYVDETSVRMPASLNDPSVTTNDNEEKDYAWGDVDQDGDIDLIIVRKQPFTSTGKRVNVLLMNEGVAEGHGVNGVLVDRTVEYATASDVPGDDGFLTATNDRDVALVDVNNDGWLDMVTAPTLTDNQAKNLSHPRIYMNLGESGGEWQGFRYEDARIPQMHPNAGPRFCSVVAGDINGDGFMDLYFGDYDSGGSQIEDYNNKLLVNDGTGFFIDESNLRLTSEMRLSAFGAASAMADMNDDGALDVIKQTSLNAPTHVAVTYNNPADLGIFNAYDTVYGNAPYFISVDDLNNDGRMDIVVVDDGTDAFMINTGNGGDGQANFTTIPFDAGDSAGFGGNSWIADLDNNGWNDIIITDVDVDIPGCDRVTQFYRSNGSQSNINFDADQSIIPTADRRGIHDVAVFDINGDGWLDLVMGECDGTKVWMNQPPLGVDFVMIGGAPQYVEPGQTTDIQIRATAVGGTLKSVSLSTSVDGSPFSTVPMTPAGGGDFDGTLPAIDCGSEISWYITGTLAGGGDYTFPENAPAITNRTTASTGIAAIVADEIEGDISGWRITSENITSGEWEAAIPNGTINSGQVAAPFEDATPNGEIAFVTGNGVEGEGAGANDVDGGPTRLETPIFDGTGEAVVSYRRWYYTSVTGKTMTVDYSIDGGNTYQPLPTLEAGSTNGFWQAVSFSVTDLVPVASPTMRLRFTVSDNPNIGIVEGGIDSFYVEASVCEDTPVCPGDIDLSGDVGFSDLVAVLSAFGNACECPEDVDGSGDVGFNDIVQLLSVWGPCP